MKYIGLIKATSEELKSDGWKVGCLYKIPNSSSSGLTTSYEKGNMVLLFCKYEIGERMVLRGYVK